LRDITETLLDWYDIHAREMPWRVMPDAQSRPSPDPYAIWLSEVMLQQTTVAAVRAYHTRFMALWLTVSALAAAEDADVMAWAGLALLCTRSHLFNARAQ
jgi:A/G-specific adenine glycosylase